MTTHVKIVSAQGPNPFFSLFWVTFIRLGGMLGQGLGLGLGPGLDNTWYPIIPIPIFPPCSGDIDIGSRRH